ncbi:MFS transporter [Aliarcobacter cibarius]|jgi:MFS family permease|uniref:MFS transporter n=1 Tax=Aliarcobacter cibarius TaxID=255507 RepID=A0ABY2V2Z4_9BACT|nr:MFS transporter [Aliarcobacter cibarius]MDD2974812.1 MFS transporter [Aliarcobacter cryaerophilus]TLS97598.1 MFS transporter [Aliarcobacter cibarius]TLS98113.1 MFS transporter [Aliarcobacter cibarius]
MKSKISKKLSLKSKIKKLLQNIFVEGTFKSVIGLGITTTIGYGTLFYSFTIMSTQIQNEFYWSKTFLFGIFSLGILLGGLIAPKVGKLLDKHGARLIMTIGSFLSFLGLYNLSLIQNEWHYIFAILFLEIVSTLVLYESAFVAFSQLAGNKARTPIIQITLIAGFASTIFWPLISYLLTVVNWREVYIILGLFHIFIAMPLHYFVLKPNLLINNDLKNSVNGLQNSVNLVGTKRKIAKYYLIFIFSLVTIPITAMQTHFMGLFQEFGFEMATAVLLGAIIGPSQVVARVIEIFFSRKVSPMTSALYSIFVLLVGLFALIISDYNYIFAFVFVIFYGAGQGLVTVIRGSLPLYLFGKNGYGEITGELNLYKNIVVATVPFGFALIIDNLGAHFAVFILILVSIISFIMLYILNKKLKVN